MASVQPSEPKTRHPVLGPAVAIYDDRRRTGMRLSFEIALLPLGLAGLAMARGDLASGSTVIGVAQAAGAVIVAIYGLLGARVDMKRRLNPIRLLIARDGFELSTDTGPVSWDEVATISDPRSPAGDPQNLRVQLDDPLGFAERHALSPIARVMLRFNKGDLILGSGMTRPVVTVETLMRRQLAEFHRSGSDGSGPSAEGKPARARAPKGRRPARKR
ncbi:MAG TPA: hypothetical protein VF293_02655 [Candidatus Limnocylindrales bacterium]